MKYDTRQLKEIFNSVRFLSSPHLLFQGGKLIVSDTITQVSIPTDLGLDLMVNSGIIPFVNALTKPEVNIEQKGNKLVIQDTVINSIPATFFEGVSLRNPDTKFVVNSELLKEAILKTHYIASKEESRQLLTGIYWYQDGIISTDAKRMSIFKFHTPIEGVVIPAKAASEITKPFYNQNITVEIGGGLIRLSAEGKEVTTRLLDGKYPNVLSKLPDSKPEFSIDRIKLLAVLKRISILQAADELDHKVLRLSAGDTLKIKAIGSLGTLEEEIKIDWLGDKEEKAIRLSTLAVIEGLLNLRSDNLLLSMDAMLHMFDSKDEKLSYLPMRVLDGDL